MLSLQTVVFPNDVEFSFEGCLSVLTWSVKPDASFWRSEEFEAFFAKVCNKLDAWKVKDSPEWSHPDLRVTISSTWLDVGSLVLLVAETTIGSVNWWHEGASETPVEVDNELTTGSVGVAHEIVGKVGGTVLAEDVTKLLLFATPKRAWHRDVLSAAESGQGVPKVGEKVGDKSWRENGPVVDGDFDMLVELTASVVGHVEVPLKLKGSSAVVVTMVTWLLEKTGLCETPWAQVTGGREEPAILKPTGEESGELVTTKWGEAL